MPDTLNRIADGTCPVILSDVFTALVKTSVLAIDISNPTVGIETIEVRIQNIVLFAVAMPAMGGVSWHGPQVLEAGEVIKMVSSSASCGYNISGVEIT